MKIVFRADASLQIGTGHVMRCLTLAEALREQGAECYFICREHEGHLLELIRRKGFIAYVLEMTSSEQTSSLAHGDWLGASQQQDAQACTQLLKTITPDWLVVDHYALDIIWESALRPFCQQLMVIDDLADRHHDANVLLDQTFGRSKEDYQALVPPHCTLLCGAQYALLRPEFTAWREYSLRRRTAPLLHRLLITMGGVDKDNATGLILTALQHSKLPAECHITVVMGATAPWLEVVQQQAAHMPWLTTVKVGVNNMAELMANSDLAIGAAGATTWERCCLGLPTLMLVLADNQHQVACNLSKTGAITLIRDIPNLIETMLNMLNTREQQNNKLRTMSQSAASIVDGSGVKKIMKMIEV
ncbi:UDP-2,4-diacetamido-2,4,6-trideoxy-beta-L-altropyranose hydrolase [Zobellella denitrificans]